MAVSKIEEWKELLAILCPADHGLFDEVKLAIEAPDEYFEEYHEELYARGIDDFSGVSGWLAMIDGLVSRKHLVEVEWKEDAERVAVQLEDLKICQDYQVDLSSLFERTENPENLFPFVADALHKHGLALCSPYGESEDWPLAVIAAEKASRLQELVKSVGEKITLFEVKQSS